MKIYGMGADGATTVAAGGFADALSAYCAHSGHSPRHSEQWSSPILEVQHAVAGATKVFACAPELADRRQRDSEILIAAPSLREAADLYERTFPGCTLESIELELIVDITAPSAVTAAA